MKDKKRHYGKFRGIVVQPVDPDTKGKLTATITLGGTPATVVAEACTPYAGPNAGFFAMPPPGAGVWIEFEEGDINKPIWTGCWWPDKQLTIGLGRGLSLDLLPIVLQSIAGNRLVVSSVPGDCITLETVAGKLGPRIVISTTSITLQFATFASVELSQSGVRINGQALTISPPVVP